MFVYKNMIFYYRDVLKDKLYLLESGERTSLNRFLDTRGGSGEPGFTGGSNEYLNDYLTKLFADKERGKEVVVEEGGQFG